VTGPRASRDAFSAALSAELSENIVPFWLAHAFDAEGGAVVGRMSRDLAIDRAAPKGLILVARLLWSFAAFARHLPEGAACRVAADRAHAYLEAHFWDDSYGGVYWTVDASGAPLDTRKKIYGQAFAIYAFAEYFRLTGSERALSRAKTLFGLIEDKARDDRFGGYFEAYERGWTLAADLRLGDDDLAAKKSMNTHLHLLESYTGLLRVWPNSDLRARIRALVQIFLARIVDRQTPRFNAFFEDDWSVRGRHVSPGHDIEGSWLLCEAAEVVADSALLPRVRARALEIAASVLSGVDDDGGIFNGTSHDGTEDDGKSWWPQAEAVVGFLNAYELSGEERYAEAAQHAFRFIGKRLVDREYGEWFWSVSRDGTPDLSKPKISGWKCPYHNGRMCIEAIARLERTARSEPL
jgi:mannobiose 2-epimerase